ncbi:MAG: Rieske 2Fe-2S domain-containing protein [Acetobacteraceae bacterium]|nr:Rieske 2Fe-2S domain-containing protein [Acetobacteraceae bacterium]
MERAIGGIESADWLDPFGYALGNALSRPMQLAGRRGRTVRDALHGSTWLGHPLHPLLVTVPVGGWTLALGLDVLGALGLGEDRGEAELAMRAGNAGAVAAAVAGLFDWQYTDGRDRRTGLVHGAVNSAALALHLLSLSLRRRGRLSQGRAASAVGWVAMFAGAYLGGHLVYRRRVGIDHADRSPEPRCFTPVLAASDLEEDRPRRVEVWDGLSRQGTGVVLVLHRGRVHALGARCAHMGGPLDGGWVLGDALVCPWHGSRFNVETGQPLGGPATCPQPRYAVRVREGTVEIRREQEPGDAVLTPGDAVQGEEPSSAGALGRPADEVLMEHHQILRRLFERIERMSPDDPDRRALMRTLAGELEMHEHIEDKIFYPEVEAVTEDVPVAHSEHRQMADLLAITLRLDTAGPEFDSHLKALHEAVNHHAGSEERSMFVQAQLLGERRLREIGHRLEAMLEEERTSRFKRAFRDLKISLLEGR